MPFYNICTPVLVDSDDSILGSADYHSSFDVQCNHTILIHGLNSLGKISGLCDVVRTEPFFSYHYYE